jgi:glycosyltransferase involved in cell wall biosynthesis
MQTPLVSIIIPTYNRTHLIAETLDSILAQTYTNWECIVVDDGSTDETDKLLAAYREKDSRFQYHHRPADRPKGANACRNYGFEISNGEYINWFDSDDLMVFNKIKLKLKTIEETGADVVISRTKYYNNNIFYSSSLNKKNITLRNYLLQEINWLTVDALIKKSVVKNIKFNEKLKSNQEYNFFSKMLCFTENVIIINEALTLYRTHKNSIQGEIREKVKLTNYRKLIAFFYTFMETYNYTNKETKKDLLNIIKFYIYNLNINFLLKFDKKYLLVKNLMFYTGFYKTILFFIGVIFKYLFSKGYYFYQRSK